MTDRELLALGDGQLVEFSQRGRWVRGRVVGDPRLVAGGQFARAHVRKLGRGSRGHTFPVLWRRARHVRAVPADAPANVYADWLEDAGFPEAAEALRRAFPLDAGR